MRRLFIMLLFASVFVSCEDVVQVKLDQGSKLYVIDAFINDYPGPKVVKVHYSEDYFSGAAPEPVQGAQVSVLNMRTGKEFFFADAGNGEHRLEGPDTTGFSGTRTQYELRVRIQGVEYKALATQKRTAVIRNIDTNFVPEQKVFGQTVASYYACELVAKDTVDFDTDYYWVQTYRNDSLLFTPADIGFGFCIDGTNGPVSGINADTTNFTAPVTFLGFKQFRSGDKCGVQIHSLSRECYLFFVQAGQQVNNAGLFATTPENVRTNIVTPEGATKAVGWFNVASVAEKTLRIP